MGKANYNAKGLYNGYDKAHKERQKEDYYATDFKEVTNILEYLGINFDGATILEPCCGGMHMVKGICDYIKTQTYISKPQILAQDIKCREWITFDDEDNYDVFTWVSEEACDVLSDGFQVYENKTVDYVIMNPPYSVIEPFTMRMLSIAEKGVLMLGRLQFLEGQGRFEKIFKDYPPSDIYIYVDRIGCYKNGDFTKKDQNAQAYAWFYFNTQNGHKETKVHWIRRVDKK